MRSFSKNSGNSKKSQGELGLIARWSREFGYISMHDPTTGEWHDVSWKDAPDWAKWEARKRKELYKGGDRGAYWLMAREMRIIWEDENPPPIEEGIIEDYPVEG